jgi:hypothetical protein
MLRHRAGEITIPRPTAWGLADWMTAWCGHDSGVYLIRALRDSATAVFPGLLWGRRPRGPAGRRR